jgi:pimeloyl-ACP methyl ester carboxylesterase
MGLGAQAVAWDDGFVQRLVDGGLHVVRFDNRDVGLSQYFDQATDSPAYTLDDMADDAAGLLDALNLAPAHIVGASMGGMIAQALAIRHPAKVRTLTSIMSTTGDEGGDPPAPEVLALLGQAPGESRDERVAMAVRTSSLLAGPGFPVDEARLRERAELSIDRAYHPEGTMRQLMGIMASSPRGEALGAVTVPTLIIHGTADPLVPYWGGELTAKSIPGARLLPIEGMGHELPKAAWDEVVPAILALTASA